MDPLRSYLFLLALQVSAGLLSWDRAASNLAEMQHELGRCHMHPLAWAA